MNHRAAVCGLLLLCLAAAPARAQEPERWHGIVDLSGAGELEFFVTFIVDGDAPSATISIPAQSARDLPLAGVVYTDARIEFTLAVTPAAVFAADRDGAAAAGTLNQGAEFPMTMERLAEDETESSAAPNRPQTPVAPFPYESREVSYTNPIEGNTIAGTLTLPEGDGPHPVALLITGSGSQDRDETIFEHKPFWVIADHLSRRGIAVLRVDDRGIGGSDGARDGLTSEDFAGDVAAGVAFLRSQDQIDGDRIGLIGHSEGGLIGPMVAADDVRIAFVVMLAGPGVTGAELLRLQNELILRAAGMSDEFVASQIELQVSLWKAMMSAMDEEVIDERLGALLDLQLSSLPAEERALARDNAFVAAKAQVTSAWLRFFLAADPAVYLEKVSAPVLALNGTLDLQVSADQNLPAVEAALERAGNADVTIRRLEHLNHLFQEATTGQVSEYGLIEETFSPAALEILAAWLSERVGGTE